ncbi:hypothetical protein Pcinc_017241 [Petrolisthes cinctipes]|uniref:Uncharacterized protein n=1 Tax=Petrolisthes cinctipes TaxID=88211 RepID=A0AAE1FR36_PETCI|nr:hypothetical protein Pcinc_017241 [Petrolisthes cinctipes]
MLVPSPPSTPPSPHFHITISSLTPILLHLTITTPAYISPIPINSPPPIHTYIRLLIPSPSPPLPPPNYPHLHHPHSLPTTTHTYISPIPYRAYPINHISTTSSSLNPILSPP